MRKTKRTLIKNKIFIIMLVVIILQSCILILTTVTTGMFDKLNKESYRILKEQVKNRADAFSVNLKTLSSNANIHAAQINKRILEIASSLDVSASELFLYDDAYYESEIAAMDVLIKMMNEHRISGGFIILNGSNFAKDDSSRHAAIYLKDTSPLIQVENNADLTIERGSQQLAQQYKIALGTFWNVDFNFLQHDAAEAFDDFYNLPIEMAKNYRNELQENMAFWSKPVCVFDDSSMALLYSVPLLDNAGTPFGIFGIEIELSLIQRIYLPYAELPYANSFYSIANVSYGYLRGDWFINSGPLASRYLEIGMKQVALKSIDKQYAISELSFVGKNEKDEIDEDIGGGVSENTKMYCSYAPINLYDNDSLFEDGGKVLLGFVPKNEMNAQSSGAFKLMLLSIAINTVIGVLLLRFAAHTATKDIAKLPEIISNFDINTPVSFAKTNIAEIDELTSAIETLYKNVNDSAIRISKIMELTSMPIGCYEAREDSNVVFVTKSLLDIIDYRKDYGDSQFISSEEWTDIYNSIVSGDIVDENVYYYVPPSKSTKNKDDTIENGNGGANGRYLRVENAVADNFSVGIILDVSEEQKRRKRLEWELDYDNLTKLLNSKAFKRKINELLTNEPSYFGVMIYADLDGLKIINDTYGHEIGDLFIMKAADMFKEFEKIGGIVSRVSGDEFVMYAHGFQTWKDSLDAVKGSIKNIAGYTFATPDGKMKKISCSFGVSSYPLDSKNISELIRYADFAMYEAKNTSKGTVCEFKKDTYLKHAFLLDKREALNRLIDNRLIKFALQPIVDVRKAEVFAYEALMRPLLDEFKTPGEIIAVAKSQSQMYRIEKLTTFAALEWLEENKHQLKGRKLFVNTLSSQILINDEINVIYNRYKHLFDDLVIEVADNDDNAGLIDVKINIFKERLNGNIAIDDYGAGRVDVYGTGIDAYNSLPDYVKIDMGLVSDIHFDLTKQEIVSEIITSCHERNILVIAKGVELEGELKTLIKLGADYAQGFYFSKPSYGFSELSDDQINKIREWIV